MRLINLILFSTILFLILLGRGVHSQYGGDDGGGGGGGDGSGGASVDSGGITGAETTGNIGDTVNDVSITSTVDTTQVTTSQGFNVDVNSVVAAAEISGMTVSDFVSTFGFATGATQQVADAVAQAIADAVAAGQTGVQISRNQIVTSPVQAPVVPIQTATRSVFSKCFKLKSASLIASLLAAIAIWDARPILWIFLLFKNTSGAKFLTSPAK